MADGDFPASHSVKAYVAVIAKNVDLRKENSRLREALEFYAAPESWYKLTGRCETPGWQPGKRARETLEKEGAD